MGTNDPALASKGRPGRERLSLYLDDSVEFAMFVMFRVLAEKIVVLYFL